MSVKRKWTSYQKINLLKKITMKKRSSLFLILSAFSILNFSYAQKMREKIEYRFDLETIKTAKSVTWFGWDYSHLVIYDAENFDVKKMKSVIVPYWYYDLDDRDKGHSVVKKKFKDKIYIDDPKSIQNLVLDVPDEQFQNYKKASLNIDSIKLIVNNYKVSGEGIGVVGIANEMRKLGISVTGFVVIFDLQTKEVLYVMNAMGKAGDKGSFGRFYSKGIAEIMGLFHKVKLK